MLEKILSGGNEVKKTLSTVLAALTLSTIGAPVFADNDVATMAKNTAWFPVQVLGVASGMVFGIPICVTRRTAVRIREYTADGADKIGGREHGPPNVFASVFGVPAGTLVGVSEGVYYGGKNAISHGVEKPFGTDSFSLGSDVTE
jgi:hypothetical protein